MKAIDYWSKLSGYWRLFKDRDVFTSLWEAMLAGSEEYSKLRDDVTHPGVLRCPDTIDLSWEKISADDGQTIRIDGKDDYVVDSVSAMRSMVDGKDYYLGDDYSVSDGTITWVSDPGEEYYLAHNVSVKTDMLNEFYNNDLFDLDLGVYNEDQRRWIMYACMRYLSKGYSVGNLNNIVAILSGVPFTKYYGEISGASDQFRLSYDIVVKGDYEKYLRENMLEGYCFIDEDAGNVYDGNYPENGLSLTLCHKSNLDIDSAGKPNIRLRGENVDYVGDINPLLKGELIPVIDIDSVKDREYSAQFDASPMPVVSVLPSEGGTVLSVPIEYADLIVDNSRMKIDYMDNIIIYGCEAVGKNTIVVDDPISHVFEVGESIIVGKGTLPWDILIAEEAGCLELIGILKIVYDYESGDAEYTNIVSGIYNRDEGRYYLDLSSSVEEGSMYGMVIPRKNKGIYKVNTSISGDMINVTVPIVLQESNMPITLMQCDETVRVYRETSLITPVEKGSPAIMLDISFDVKKGDVISVSEGGNQDFYVVSLTDNGSVYLVPDIIRNYSTSAVVYNNKDTPSLHTVDITMPEDAVMRENIKKYFNIWSMGHTMAETEIEQLKVSDALSIDDRFWTDLGGGIMKEIR